MNLKVRWLESIDLISVKDWNNIFDTIKIVKSYDFTKAVEQSSLSNFRINYMVIYNINDIIAILPCFIYSIELETLAGNKIKSLVSKLRRFYPKFLMARVLGIGSPVATCENHIGIASNISKDQQKSLGSFILNELLTFSKNNQINLIIVKEVPENEKNNFKIIFEDKFQFYESLPNSFIPIGGAFNPYPIALRKKYRQRFRNAIKVSSDAMIKWESVEDFASLSDDICDLYLNVYQKSQYKFERLNSNFFHHINKFLPKNSFLLIAKNSHDILLAVELVLEEKDSLIPLYLGLNYENIDNTDRVYQNVIFRSLIEAEKRNKKYVILGQTSYTPKAYFKNDFFNIILKIIFPYLFPAFEKPFINCYKEQFKEDLNIFMKDINRIPIK
jgi:predicted N-acyltransferase